MKFFVDNNLPPPLAHALRELSKPDGHSVFHLKDRYKADTPDVDWIGGLSDEGGWVVVTHDNLNKGLEREALRQAGLLVFFLDKSWCDHKFWEKAHNLVRWWPRIIEQASGIQGGAAFKVKWNFSGKGMLSLSEFLCVRHIPPFEKGTRYARAASQAQEADHGSAIHH